MIPDWLEARLVLKNKDGIVSVEKIKYEEEPCEDCGKCVCNRRLTIRKNTVPRPHWKITCLVCNLSRNPDTGEFERKTSQYMREKYGI